jgi:hypothetical protein
MGAWSLKAGLRSSIVSMPQPFHDKRRRGALAPRLNKETIPNLIVLPQGEEVGRQRGTTRPAGVAGPLPI